MRPLVTALLPTIYRERTQAQRALACILSQDWTNLEVLILDDRNKPSFDDDPGLSKVWYCRVGEPYLWAKLNLASRIAGGEYLVHFYDDDYSSPFRITDQVTRLEESGKAVTSYRNLQFSDGLRVWLNSNWPGGYGMSLAYRRDWALRHPFPAIRQSEDWPFVEFAMQKNQFIAGEAKEHMMVTLSPWSQIGQGWKELP